MPFRYSLAYSEIENYTTSKIQQEQTLENPRLNFVKHKSSGLVSTLRTEIRDFFRKEEEREINVCDEFNALFRFMEDFSHVKTMPTKDVIIKDTKFETQGIVFERVIQGMYTKNKLTLVTNGLDSVKTTNTRKKLTKPGLTRKYLSVKDKNYGFVCIVVADTYVSFTVNRYVEITEEVDDRSFLRGLIPEGFVMKMKNDLHPHYFGVFIGAIHLKEYNEVLTYSLGWYFGYYLNQMEVFYTEHLENSHSSINGVMILPKKETITQKSSAVKSLHLNGDKFLLSLSSQNDGLGGSVKIVREEIKGDLPDDNSCNKQYIAYKDKNNRVVLVDYTIKIFEQDYSDPLFDTVLYEREILFQERMKKEGLTPTGSKIVTTTDRKEEVITFKELKKEYLKKRRLDKELKKEEEEKNKSLSACAPLGKDLDSMPTERSDEYELQKQMIREIANRLPILHTNVEPTKDRTHNYSHSKNLEDIDDFETSLESKIEEEEEEEEEETILDIDDSKSDIDGDLDKILSEMSELDEII